MGDWFAGVTNQCERGPTFEIAREAHAPSHLIPSPPQPGGEGGQGPGEGDVIRRVQCLLTNELISNSRTCRKNN